MARATLPTIDELANTLDNYCARLAYELVAADAGTRAKPFAAFSARATEKQLAALAPADKAAEVLAIVDKIGKTRPSPPLRSICRVCSKAAKALQRAAKREA